jgi:hypothetical protein
MEAVAIDQGLHRLRNLALDESAHLEETGAQAAQILLVLAIGVLRLRGVHRASFGLIRSAR